MLISGDDKRNSPLFLASQLPAVVAYLAQHKQLNKQGHRTALTQTAGATTRTCHTSLHVTEIQQNGIKTYLAPQHCCPLLATAAVAPSHRLHLFQLLLQLHKLPMLFNVFLTILHNSQLLVRKQENA